MVRALLLWLALACCPGGVEAQVSLTTTQALGFGDLLPGTLELVSPDDAWRRGEVRLDGTGTMSIRMLLPSQLQSASGTEIPVGFGSTSARVDPFRASKPIYFDPAAGTTVKIPPGQNGALIYLGGEARPSTDQAAGSYGASVVVIVTRTDT